MSKKKDKKSRKSSDKGKESKKSSKSKRNKEKHKLSKTDRTKDRSRSRDRKRHKYSRHQRHKRHRRRDRDKDGRSRRYKRSRRYHSRSRSSSSSLSSVKSDKKQSNVDDIYPCTKNTQNPNGSKCAEIKATAPNAMQQLNNGTQSIADPLAAFNSVFGNRPPVLALTNPVQQSNVVLQQLLSGSNPYKLNCGVSGSQSTINPLLMNKMAMELRNSAKVEEQRKSAAVKVAEAKSNNDESLLFTVHLPGMNLPSIGGGIHPQITRPARRLYVGNLPVGMGLTEQILCAFFTQCSKGLGIATTNPVLSVWLNSEQTFGFIEFRSVQDTNLALQLFEGLQLGGRQLRFGRPVDYKEPPNDLKDYIVGERENGHNIEKGSPAAMLMMQQQDIGCDHHQQQIAKQSLDIAILNKQKAMFSAMNNESNVLLLMNMVCEDDIAVDEEYNDIVDDIECECVNYGTLLSVLIPRIGEKGCGRVFLKYENASQAKKCKLKVDGRKFGNNTVKCVYFRQELFDDMQFDHNVE